MLTFSHLKTQKPASVQVDKKLDDYLKTLQETAGKTNVIKLDFPDFGLDDKTFKKVVKTCLELFQKYKALKVATLNFTGKNSLTDDCMEDLVNLINGLPNTHSMQGIIDVYMSRGPFEEVEFSVENKQKINGNDFVITLNNKKTSMRL